MNATSFQPPPSFTTTAAAIAAAAADHNGVVHTTIVPTPLTRLELLSDTCTGDFALRSNHRFTPGPLVKRKLKKPTTDDNMTIVPDTNDTDYDEWGVRKSKVKLYEDWDYLQSDDLNLVNCWSLDGKGFNVPKTLLIRRCGYFKAMYEEHPDLFQKLEESSDGFSLYIMGDDIEAFFRVLLNGFISVTYPEELNKIISLLDALEFYQVKYDVYNITTRTVLAVDK